MDLSKPARKQVEKKVETQAAHLLDYNIWWHQYLGEDKEVNEQRSATRCHVAADAGYTKGDRTNKAQICLFFARGCCFRGKDCDYLHRIPLPEDEERLNLMYDVFGRDRHRIDKEDMSGVGSFMRECKTLYISGFTVSGEKETQDTLMKHFGEWGKVERIRVIAPKNIAFVTYSMRSSAEFAKEAMKNQSLDDNELLTVRWATENEAKQERTKLDDLRDQERVLDAIENRLRQKGMDEQDIDMEVPGFDEARFNLNQKIEQESRLENKESSVSQHQNELPPNFKINLTPPVAPTPPKQPSFLHRISPHVLFQISQPPESNDPNIEEYLKAVKRSPGSQD
ncbi:putative Pre-mRNA-splicing factor cwc2 [Blattamonas nauphoetae]|uniref:Pre-mRNA-splicing factor cwc2 n=1 Tax=Blattamonas nauphoetae TaxID=2049346 RepID=A0ABQ9YED4_9EUKA|nr:putative Pre-mRNA-splicing factor cwc2 [Blattamonas nauphoetae]